MQIFGDALERHADKRESYLREACGDDHELLAEVQSLLSYHDPRTLAVTRDAAARSDAGEASVAAVPQGGGWKIPRGSAGRGRRTVSLVALLLAALLGLLAYWLETGIDRRLRANLAGQLQATLDSNVAAVVNWLEVQKQQVASWASHPQLAEDFSSLASLAQRSDAGGNDLLETKPGQRVIELLAPLLARDDVRAVIVANASGMVVLRSYHQLPGPHQLSPEGAKQIAPVFLGQTILLPPTLGSRLVTVEAANVADVPTIVIGSPIRDAQGSVLGGLFVTIESDRDFTRLLDLGRAGERADTYAFGPRGQLLSASRYEPQLRSLGMIDDAADSTSVLTVTLRDPGVDLTTGRTSKFPPSEWPLTKMAAAAISGIDSMDLDGYRDYRGVRVVGAWNWLDQYGFGVATEIDFDDAYAVLHYVRRSLWIVFTLLLGVSTVAFLSALSVVRLRRQVGEARQLGQYTLEQLIGEGGMGKVYKARHALLRRPTAVKVLDGQRVDARAVARFEREVQLASSLTHPNTVEVYDYGRADDGLFYFAMEYLPGLTLGQLVRQEGAICAARVLHILRQMLGSLAEAHDLGLIHRDIKPANVILCRRGGEADFVKVVDFGLAKDLAFDLAPQITQPGLISGTPLYIAPECLHDPNSLSPAADIYAVGVVAFYLLTGRDLFVGSNSLKIFDAVMNQPAPRPSDVIHTTIPAELDNLVYRCVAKTPSDRPASAHEMIRAIESLAAVYRWTQEDADRWWESHEQHQA